MNIISFFWFVSVFSICFCLPPHRRPDQHLEDNKIDENLDQENGYSMEQLGIEYTRYLQQVVEALEKDETFKKKLENAQEHEIKSAKIAEELEYVNHHVRSKLDELKRTELQRLRELAKQAYRSEDERSSNPFGHLDHENPNTFEIKDLKKLIHKVAQDLEDADKKRKEAFKTYEMEKHFEREQMLKNMTEEERKKFIQQEEEAKRREEVAAKRVHHPGSKQQLEDVWENQDHMNKNDFNPKTFFAMHDVDNNNFLDEEEIKTLFIKELDKLYASGSLTGDMMERAEEMERMREHVFNEVDKNKDRLISWEEFDAMSRQSDFNEDPGWQPLDQNQVYTSEEWQAYERQRLAEIEKLRREGKLPPDHGYYPAQANGGYPDQNVHYGGNGYAQPYYPQQGGHPQQMAGYQQQMGGNPQQMAGYQHQMAGQPQQMGGYPHQQQMAGNAQAYPQPPPVGPAQQQGFPQQVQYQNQAPNVVSQSNGVPVQQHQQAQPVLQSNNVLQQQQPQPLPPQPVQQQQPQQQPIQQQQYQQQQQQQQQQQPPVQQQQYQQQQPPVQQQQYQQQQQQQPVHQQQFQQQPAANINPQQTAGVHQAPNQPVEQKVVVDHLPHQPHLEAKRN